MTDLSSPETRQEARDIAARAWEADLAELAEAVRVFDHWSTDRAMSKTSISVESDRATAVRLVSILQARATIEAAKLQVETADRHQQQAKDLVKATWWLVGVTFLLAVASVLVSLYLG